MKLRDAKLASLEDVQDELSEDAPTNIEYDFFDDEFEEQMQMEFFMKEDTSTIKKTTYKAKPLTPEQETALRHKYSFELMCRSAFLLKDYLKTFEKDDYARYSVSDTIDNLVKQIQFEWVEQCKNPTFKDIPDYGDKMTVKDWIDCVNSGGFIDYDGSGCLSTDKFRSDISISPSDVTFFKVEIPMWATHVIWFNK